MKDLIFTIQTKSSKKVYESEVGTDAIQCWIYLKPTHHLTAILVGLFQIREGHILVAKSQVN